MSDRAVALREPISSGQASSRAKTGKGSGATGSGGCQCQAPASKRHILSSWQGWGGSKSCPARFSDLCKVTSDRFAKGPSLRRRPRSLIGRGSRQRPAPRAEGEAEVRWPTVITGWLLSKRERKASKYELQQA